MNDPVDKILARLDGVKRTQKGWIARCPAHDDRNPSLSIARGDDGRVLMRCWAGCSALDIVQSIGLDLGDLFHKEHNTHQGRQRLYPSARQILEVIKRDVWIVLIAAQDTHNGKLLSDSDMESLTQSVANLQKIIGACNA